MKKLLALVLALVMSMSLVTISNAAFDDADEIDYTEAVEVMNAVGVLSGGDGNKFNPQAELTRAQACKIIAYLDLGEKVAEALPSVQVFSDVPASNWAAKYIAYCADAGYVSGVGDNKFDPDAKVTGYQFGKMLLCALGYDADVEQMTGANWQIAVAKLMEENDINDGVDKAASAVLTREEAAQYALNALKATTVEYDDKGTVIEGNGLTITTKAKKAESVYSGADYATAIYAGTPVNDKYTLELGEKLFKGDLELTEGTPDDLKRPAHTWDYDDLDDAIGTYADEADYVVVLDKDYSDEATDAEGTLDVIQDLTGNSKLFYKTVGNTNDVKLYVNGVDKSGYNASGFAYAGTTVEIFLSDTKNEIETIVAYYYELDQITDVDDDLTASEKKNDHSAELTLEVYGEVYDDEIPGYNAKTYVEDAYIAALFIYERGENNTVTVSSIYDSYIVEPIKGSVSVKNADDGFVTMDGTKYYASVMLGYNVFDTDIDDVSTGSDNTYGLYVDKNGALLGIDVIDADDAAIDEVYYVDEIWSKSSTVSGASVDLYYAQLVSVTDGTVKEVTLEDADKNDTDSNYVANKASYVGKLVNLTDSKWTDDNGDKHKKGDEVFDLELWTNGDFDVYTVDLVEANYVTLKKDTSRVSLKVNGETDKTTFRLNSATNYVMIEGTQNKLEVTKAVGGISFDISATTISQSQSCYVITEDDSAVAKYVVLVCVDADQKTDYTDDVVFVKSLSSTEGDGYFEQTVYMNDGTKKTWNVDEDMITGNDKITEKKFYTYGDNSDGYVVFDDATTIASGSYVWDDEEGVINEATIAAGFYYDENGEALVTVKVGNDTISDIDVSNAKFVDLHDTDEGYESSINSVARLNTLIKNSKVSVSSVKLAMNVTEDGATVIFLLEANAQ